MELARDDRSLFDLLARSEAGLITGPMGVWTGTQLQQQVERGVQLDA
jgi:hypothetical protein